MQFGVDESGGGPQDVFVKFYTLGSTFEVANLVQIGATVTVSVPDQQASLITVPLNPNISFDTQDQIVVEILSPDGSTAGTYFYPGSNASGQSAPTYIRAPDCGLDEPTDTAAIGFPDMHLVMTLDVGACGDGVAEADAGETCDDGNTDSDDGCDSNCTITACGNGVVTSGETCDDGNTTSGDGCDSNCTQTACGNGVVTTGDIDPRIGVMPADLTAACRLLLLDDAAAPPAGP